MAWPQVTVVVPVGPGATPVAECLQALLNQDYPRERLEIVVALDRVDAPTRTWVAGRRERVATVEVARPGASAARNAGIRRASTELIAFIDADCVPDQRWLREIVRHHQDDDTSDLVGGRIEPFRPTTAVGAFAARLMDQAAAVSHPRTPHVITANMLARRADLIRLGLFDETLMRGQDVDLSLRAGFDLGLRLGYAPSACVHHHNVSTVSGLWRKGKHHGLAVFYVLDKHGLRLGLTPGQWLCGRALNLRMVASLVRALALPWAWIRGDTALTRRFREDFHQGVFDIGKRWGLLCALCSRPGRGPRRSSVPGSRAARSAMQG